MKKINLSKLVGLIFLVGIKMSLAQQTISGELSRETIYSKKKFYLPLEKEDSYIYGHDEKHQLTEKSYILTAEDGKKYYIDFYNCSPFQNAKPCRCANAEIVDKRMAALEKVFAFDKMLDRENNRFEIEVPAETVVASDREYYIKQNYNWIKLDGKIVIKFFGPGGETVCDGLYQFIKELVEQTVP